MQANIFSPFQEGNPPLFQQPKAASLQYVINGGRGIREGRYKRETCLICCQMYLFPHSNALSILFLDVSSFKKFDEGLKNGEENQEP